MDKLNIQEVSEKLWQMHIAVSGFYNEYAKSEGLTLAEFKVLVILWREKNPTQKKITQLTYLPKQTVNVIIKGFVNRGLISEPIELDTDKRNKVISFTKNGKKEAESIIEKAKKLEYSALSSLGKERINALLDALTIYKNNLKVE